MADRLRSPDLANTPTAVALDIRDLHTAQQDISDFIPTMKGGADIAVDQLATPAPLGATPDNMVPNGSFDVDIAGWTLNAGDGVFGYGTTAPYSGAGHATYAPGGSVNTHRFSTDYMPIASDVTSLHLAGVVRYLKSTHAGKAYLRLLFYNDTPTLLASWLSPALVLDNFTNDTYIAIDGDCPVPAGATQVIARVELVTTGFAVAGEVFNFDEFKLTASTVFTGVHPSVGDSTTGLYGVSIGTASPAAKTSANNVNTWQPWTPGGSADWVTFAYNPTWRDLSLVVIANLYGTVTNAGATAAGIRVRVEISLDNGSTWQQIPSDLGYAQFLVGPNAQVPFSVAWPLTLPAPIDPATVIAVRGSFAQGLGTVGDYSFQSGFVFAQTLPKGS